MKHFYSRIASIVLAFGFLFGCSILNSTTNTNNKSGDLSSKSQVKKKLSDVNNRLTQSDSTAALLYQKGDLLIKLAHKQQISARLSTYRQAHDYLMLADKKYKQSGNTNNQDKASKLLNVSWSEEHNQGIHIIQDDSTASVLDYKTAGNHFHNATAIIPDSATSYLMGARSFYNANQPSRSVNLLEEARQQIQHIPASLLEELAFLYQEVNQTNKAVQTYKQAASLPSQSANILHGLSNAYIAADNHKKAVELLKNLVQEEPKNIIYKQSLATELYFLGEQKVDQWTTKSAKIKSKNDFQSVDSLFQQASSYYSDLLKTNGNDTELKKRIAQFYINSAANYQQLLSKSKKPYTATIHKRVKKYLKASLPLNKELAEKDPNQKRYRRNLYQAYTYLGMNQKARNLKSN